MKHITVLCLLLGTVFAREKQINLEDIERDNLNSERNAQTQQVLKPNNQLPPQHFFVTQRPELSVGPNLFSPDAREYPIFQQFAPQFANQPSQYLQQSPGPIQQQIAFPQPVQQLQHRIGNNQVQYLQQGFTPSSRYALVQAPGVNTQGQPNYRAQYPYLDPNTELLKSPNLEFALSKTRQSHNLAGLLQRNAHTIFLQPNYKQPVPQTYALQGLASQPIVSQPVYVLPQPTATNLNPVYQRNNQVLGQQRFLVPGVIYARNQPAAIYPPQQQAQPQTLISQPSNTNLVYEKNGPLVGVYVPSSVQIEYYKQLQQLQQQQQTNSVIQPGKTPTDVSGKGNPIKTFEAPQVINTDFPFPFPLHNNVK